MSWCSGARPDADRCDRDVLVKEAYIGEMSRAIFPLTPEFQKISSNSTVGATGKAKVIADVESFEGPYYGWSPLAVRSRR